MLSPQLYTDLIASQLIEPPCGPVFVDAACAAAFAEVLAEEQTLWPNSEAAAELLAVCGHVAAGVARLGCGDTGSQVALTPQILAELGLWRRGVLLHSLPRAATAALEGWIDRLCEALRHVSGAPNRARVRASLSRTLTVAADLALAELLLLRRLI